MDIIIYGLLIVSAAAHAGWNAVVKGSGGDKLYSMALVSFYSSVASLCFLPFVAPLPAEAYLWLAGSLVVHMSYKLCLTKAYRLGDLAQVYPISRGSAVLFITIAAYVFLGEVINLLELTFILLLVSGVMLASYKGGRVGAAQKGQLNGLSVLWALATALCIATYVMVDAIGARIGGDGVAFVVWLLSFEGVAFYGIACLLKGREAAIVPFQQWKVGMAGGALSLMAYAIAIWAMVQISLAPVAALRESSVLFAILFSWWLVKEPINRYRVIAALLIVAGTIGIKFT